MARLTAKQIQAILKEQRLVAVDAPRRPRRPRAEATAPDAKKVKSKWIGQAAVDAAKKLEKLDDEDLESVTTKPEREGLDQAGDRNAKEAILSKTTGGIIGKQG